jgi:hypothetical protein
MPKNRNPRHINSAPTIQVIMVKNAFIFQLTERQLSLNAIKKAI